MEPLQLISFESTGQARQRLHDSLPGAPLVPYRRTRRQDAVAGVRNAARIQLAGLLRRTADHVEPWAAPYAS